MIKFLKALLFCLGCCTFLAVFVATVSFVLIPFLEFLTQDSVIGRIIVGSVTASFVAAAVFALTDGFD